MKRWTALVLTLFVLLGVTGPATSQGPGLFVRTDCTTLTGPVTGQTWCFDATARALKVWNGTAYDSTPVPPTSSALGGYAVRNLLGQNDATTPNTLYGYSADLVQLRNPTDGSIVVRLNTAVLTNNTGLAGVTVNGRDQSGAFPAQAWIHFYWIWNGTTLGTLSSLSAPLNPFTTPAAPTVAVGAAGNVNTGAHTWTVTFLGLGNESAEGTASASLNPGVASIVNLTAVPTGPTGTVARKIYRSLSGDAAPRRYVGAIADNTTTTFTDNVADASLLFVPPGSGLTLPTGYTHWAYGGAVYYNATPLLVLTRMRGSWMSYEVNQAALNAGAATAETAVGVPTFIPPNALNWMASYISGAAVTSRFRLFTGSDIIAATISGDRQVVSVPNHRQQFLYINDAVGGSVTVQVLGYSVANGGE